jgi:cytochrome c-type biogenesis protein
MGLAATSSTSTAWRGTGLAFIYCLGLGTPFVVAAIASEWATGVSAALRRKGQLIGMIGGIFLITLGVSEIAGWWPTIIHWVQDLLPTTTPPL